MAGQRDLLVNLERMRREMDQFFGDVWEAPRLAPKRQTAFSPRVDVYYCGGPPRAIVKAELAGVQLDSVALEIGGRELMISGKRPVSDTEGRVYQQLEIPTGTFRRAVELNTDVDAEQARATLEDGILRIELPLRDAGEGPRRVPIEKRE
ncbi:MAG: Hsp20/alpha crystallin family protein [Solirubrobacterales bacterium]